MNNNEYAKIPIELLISKKLLENNCFYPFKRIKIGSKYNFLDENNQVASDIWFTKIDGDFLNDSSVIVSKNGSKYNVFNLKKEFLFDEWYYFIKKIPYDKSYNKKSYIVYKDRYKCNIFVEGKGFVSDKWYYNCEYLSGSDFMYKFYDYSNNIDKIKLYNAKTNELYKNEYTRVNELIYNKVFVLTNNLYGENGCVNEIYNVIDFNTNELLCDTWVTEPPKEGVDDNHLLIYGDNNLGYYIVNNKKEISENFDNVIYNDYSPREYSFGDKLKFNSFSGLIVAIKGDKYFLVGKNGEIIKDNDAIINILLEKIKNKD